MKKMKSVIENQPTIDPETLPIVQELRKELVGDWITMVTQKNAGQVAYRKKGQIDWANAERVKMGILCETVALVLSGELDKLEEDAG